MRVFIVPDSFKGSLSSYEIIQVLEHELKATGEIKIFSKPLFDGGEGTLVSLVHELNGTIEKIKVHDALGNDIIASLGFINANKAIIELAEASGIEKVMNAGLNPYSASTFGTGELIKFAIDKGYKEINLTLGGSATVDGGIGIVQALGGKFYDEKENLLQPNDPVLFKWATVDLMPFVKYIEGISFTVAVDVKNTLCGKQGAAYIYGPQKGVPEYDLAKFDHSLKRWGNYLENKFDKEIISIMGTGAAGGAMLPFLIHISTKIVPGFDLALECLGYENYISDCDYIITGEGQLDKQTLMGKGVGEIIKLGKKLNKQVIVVTGRNALDSEALSTFPIIKVFSISNEASSYDDSFINAKLHLARIGKKIADLISNEC